MREGSAAWAGPHGLWWRQEAPPGKWQHRHGAALGVCWSVVVYLVRSVSCRRTFPQESWGQMWDKQLVALLGLGVLVRAVEGELGRLAKM